MVVEFGWIVRLVLAVLSQYFYRGVAQQKEIVKIINKQRHGK